MAKYGSQVGGSPKSELRVGDGGLWATWEEIKGGSKWILGHVFDPLDLQKVVKSKYLQVKTFLSSLYKVLNSGVLATSF